MIRSPSSYTPRDSSSGVPPWMVEDVKLLDYLLREYNLTRAQVRSAMKAAQRDPESIERAD